jgi:hypothetical protein
MTLKLLLIIAFLFSSVLAGYALPYSVQNPDIVRVSLEISADKSEEAEVEEYLRSRLKDVGNIKITTVEPDYTVRVLLTPIRNKERAHVGYAASVVLSLPVSERLISNLKFHKRDQGKLLRLRQQLITQHFVLIGNDVEEICNRIAKKLEIHKLK